MTGPGGGFRRETAVAIEAVERALAVVGDSEGSLSIRSKGVRDIVTATDLAVEEAVRGVLGGALGHAVVGEERGGDAPGDGSPYWLVDPICGTRNLASGIPLYCVNVALVKDGLVTVAAVGDPSGEVSVAELGRGAWAAVDGTWRRLAASPESDTICIEDSHAEGPRRECAARFAAGVIRANRWELRSLSTTLSLPYVAAGRTAADVQFWSSALHAGAGILLATEAGAVATDLDGRPWTLNSDSSLTACDGQLHGELLDLSRQAGEV
jgi:myo-inositol-1(or 4)-monophosphatase